MLHPMEKAAALIARYPRWLALLSGGISATGFAPLNLWPLTLLCLALLMHLVASAQSGKRAFLLGWLFGVGHFSVGNNWIATAFTFQAAMPEWLGWIAVVLLSLYLAIYPALACWGAWWVSRRVSCKTVSMPFILAFAGCWIVTEWLRAWVFTGFAWNPLATIILPIGGKTAQLFGTYGLSGLIVLVIGLLTVSIGPWLVKIRQNWRDGTGLSYLAVGVLVAIGLVKFAANPVFLYDMLIGEEGDRGSVNLTIAQPNISQIDKHTVGYEAINFARLAQNSRSSGDGARILFWPESAIPWWLEDGYPPQAYANQPGGSAATTRATLAKLLGPDDLLLTGGDRLEFGADGRVAGARNSALALNAKGEILATYDKAHLVPYGEYLALRWLLEPLGVTRLVPGAFDFWPGPGPRTLNLPFNGKRVKVGVQICYEIIFSGQVVDRTNRPDFIFNPSNEAWYGPWASPQFVAMARLRAIEEGLPVVRATPTGISAVIDADGRVTDALPSGKPSRIDAILPAAKAPTFFARYGNIVPLAFATLLIAASFLPLVRRRISG
jgi:apolipoprotein N-acyltransferase